MSRKVYVTVQVGLIIDMDDDAILSDVINELDYSFSDQTGKATIVDSNLEDYSVEDSK